MEKVDVALVTGVAGFLLGAGSVFFAVSASKEANVALDDAHKVMANDSESLGAMGAQLKTLDESVKALGKRVDRAGTDPAKLWDAVKALQAKVDALEQGKVATIKPGVEEHRADDGAAAKDADEFAALEKKVFSGEATADEQADFWAKLRTKPEILQGLMKDAEKAVADNPRDKDLRRRLASVYLAKLMTVPDGMEKGVWSNKMIEQEKAIVDIDPDDRDAHFSIATNYSFWPEQFNKRPDAIKEFEACLKIQEQKTQEPKFAQTYLQLRILYLKDGRTDDAKKMLDEGLRRFPDDEELKKAKEGAK
jgi:tetratricopeptide (TPR) repeat protein